MADRRCAVCNAVFRASPSDKTVTCSKACSSVHRSRKHIGKRNIWSDTSLARDAAARTGNLTKGTPAAKRSPIAGPFETNRNAKCWIVVAPEGTDYYVRNLRLWCEEHAALFAPRPWRNAYAGLRQVAAWLAGKRPRQVSQWRGWTLKELPRKS